MSNASAFESVKMDIRHRLESTEDSLRREANSLILDLQRMIEALDADLHINDFGVVQNAGPKIDRLCALRQEYVNTAKRVEWLEGQVS